FCRLAYDILLLGKDPLPIEKRIRVAMQKALVERAAGVYWAGAVRKLIRTHPDVLD
ncbi:class II aldolase/adducin family protein, partial [Rhodococcus hoagii]|nr:class II aldolase/adducin family protein [Prescottella equi]